MTSDEIKRATTVALTSRAEQLDYPRPPLNPDELAAIRAELDYRTTELAPGTYWLITSAIQGHGGVPFEERKTNVARRHALIARWRELDLAGHERFRNHDHSRSRVEIERMYAAIPAEVRAHYLITLGMSL